MDSFGGGMAKTISARRNRQPEILFIRVGNLRELLAVFGESFHHAINDAVLERVLACGVPPRAIALGSEFVSVDLTAFSRSALGSLKDLDDFAYRMVAIISREPVMCGNARAYLQVLTDFYCDQELTSITVSWVESAMTAVKQRRSQALHLDIVAASALLDELRAGNLVLSFQPIHLLGKGGVNECLYSEALLRRVSRSDGRVYAWPNAIEALERTGWITRLDCSVIWTVVRLLEIYPVQCIGCNVSAASFRRGSWWNTLMSYLDVRPGISKRLVLEITETSTIYDSKEALTIVGDLRKCGVRVALDDIGAGNSTLEFLSEVRPDVVKIDRSILLRSRDPLYTPDLVRNLTKVCSDYSPCVVIEGVESKSELQTATYAGASAVQGYGIEEPNISPAWLCAQNQVVVLDIYAELELAPQAFHSKTISLL